MKRYPLLIGGMLMIVFFISPSFALVDKTQNWLPLQQIAIFPTSTTSVDNNNNGIVDNAESLQGHSANDFLLKKGDVLKGILFLYYGVGQIVDLDDPRYYIDPSSSSNFKTLCIRGKCINSWSDLSTSLDEDALRNLIVDQVHLIERELNVNSSTYANNLVGINRRDLKDVLSLKNFCISGNCSEGIDAISLRGHKVGSNISDIPIVNPNVVYDNLKVGYSSFSLFSNNTYYVSTMKSKDVVSTLKTLNDTSSIAIINVEKLKRSNETLWNKLEYLTNKINHGESIVLNSLNDDTVKNTLVNLLKDEGFLQIQACSDNSLVLIKKQGDYFVIKCVNPDVYLNEKVKNELKNKKCMNGVVSGFNSKGDLSCESYSTLASQLQDNGIASKDWANNRFINKPSCSDGEILVYKNNNFVCEKKKNIIEDLVSCNNGFLYKSNRGYECIDYSRLANGLIGYGSLISDLKNRDIASKDWANNRFIHKPYCSNGEILVYDSSTQSFECKRLSISGGISLEDERTFYSPTTPGPSTTTHHGSNGEVDQFTCPTGYVMTGVNVKYKDVYYQGSVINGFDTEPVIEEMSIICSRLDVNGEISYQ